MHTRVTCVWVQTWPLSHDLKAAMAGDVLSSVRQKLREVLLLLLLLLDVPVDLLNIRKGAGAGLTSRSSAWLCCHSGAE